MALVIEGRVFSGMGKGKYYVGHPEYQKRFEEKLGYRPFPGTLNVKLESEESSAGLRKLRQSPGVRVEGFTVAKENFSSLKCFEGRLKDDRATLLVIEITHYNESVMELISQTYLRGRYQLVDGDPVRFESAPRASQDGQ